MTSLLTIGLCLLLSLSGLPTWAASVSQIMGGAVAVPVIGTSSAALICQAPAWCPTFFDNDKLVAGKYYGDAFSSSGGFSNNCHISTDSGGSWTTLCAGAYPTANIPREMDVTANNVLLSLRYEAASNNVCRLDRSVDGGASWTTVTVAAGANTSCLNFNLGYVFERMRCQNSVCLVMVKTTGGVSNDVYKSTDDGATWFLAQTGIAFWIPAELFYNGSIAVFSFVSGGDDTLTSTDGGTSWATKSGNLANTTNCGGSAEDITQSMGLGGTVIGCLQSAVGFKLLNAGATLDFTPIQPSGYAYLTTNGVAVRSRITGHVYFNAMTNTPIRGRLFQSINGGSIFTEMVESVAGTIDPRGNHNARAAGRNLIFSTNGETSFASTQMIRLSGGE